LIEPPSGGSFAWLSLHGGCSSAVPGRRSMCRGNPGVTPASCQRLSCRDQTKGHVRAACGASDVRADCAHQSLVVSWMRALPPRRSAAELSPARFFRRPSREDYSGPHNRDIRRIKTNDHLRRALPARNPCRGKQPQHREGPATADANGAGRCGLIPGPSAGGSGTGFGEPREPAPKPCRGRRVRAAKPLIRDLPPQGTRKTGGLVESIGN
jgi:hypothetical protein